MLTVRFCAPLIIQYCRRHLLQDRNLHISGNIIRRCRQQLVLLYTCYCVMRQMGQAIKHYLLCCRLCSHYLLHLQCGTDTVGIIVLEPLAPQSHCRSKPLALQNQRRSKATPAKRGLHFVRNCSSRPRVSGS